MEGGGLYTFHSATFHPFNSIIVYNDDGHNDFAVTIAIVICSYHHYYHYHYFYCMIP